MKKIIRKIRKITKQKKQNKIERIQKIPSIESSELHLWINAKDHGACWPNFCTKCNDKLDNDDNFCDKCGTETIRLRPYLICKECGCSNQSPYKKRCKDCGTELEKPMYVKDYSVERSVYCCREKYKLNPDLDKRIEIEK